MKDISLTQMFILNHIEVGSVKVIVDLTKDNLTNSVVRQIMAAALHAMEDNQLDEIIVKTTGHEPHRSELMKFYDCYPYGSQKIHYRLVNPTHEDRRF